MKSIKKKFFKSNVLTLLIFAIQPSNDTSNSLESLLESNTMEAEAPESVPFKGPYINNDFYHFKEALAFKESQGRYYIVNKYGYLGKYQFGKTTLERFAIYDTKEFLKNHELQEQAFIALCKVNKWILRKDIQRSVGKKINGIVITESGILAAAHLAGAGNVKKFLRSQGNTTFADAFGTSIENYMEKFAGYDTSNIVKDRMPSLKAA